MNDFKMKSLLRMAYAMASAAFVPICVARAQERVETRMFELTYASAEEVAENFNRTWRGQMATNGVQVVAGDMAVPFKEANSVMVTAPTSVLEDCAAMIAKIDRKPRQVYIEARFVELKNKADYYLGIDWRNLSMLEVDASGGAGISQQRIPSNISRYAQEATTGSRGKKESYEFTKGGTADNSYFHGTLSIDQMKVVLAAFQGCEDVSTFSNPKVIVTSGKEATVDMTRKRPNVVASAKRVLNGSNNTLDVDTRMMEIPGRDNLMFAHEAFFSWGVALGVRPRILTNDLINVSIIPTISDVTEYVTVNVNDGDDIPAPSFPIVDIQRIVTEFTLKSGQTAVIGGLSKTVETAYDNGIPYLCDIPWIGNKLFGGKGRVKEQREIIIFVTVGLADPDDIKSDVGLPKNAVLGRTYTNGTRKEPGDRSKAVEGVMSLDLRDLEDRAKETAGVE